MKNHGIFCTWENYKESATDVVLFAFLSLHRFLLFAFVLLMLLMKYFCDQWPQNAELFFYTVLFLRTLLIRIVFHRSRSLVLVLDGGMVVVSLSNSHITFSIHVLTCCDVDWACAKTVWDLFAFLESLIFQKIDQEMFQSPRSVRLFVRSYAA